MKSGFKYEVLGITYDGVKILKPATPSKHFTQEEVAEVIRKWLTTKSDRV